MTKLLGVRPGLGVPARDLRLPVVLALITQVDLWLPRPLNLGHVVGPRPVVALLYAATSLLLSWRRVAPLAVLALVVAADAVEYLTFGAPEGLGSLLPTVVAFYAVGRHARDSALAVAAPLVLLGIAVHELTDPEFVFGGPNAVFYGVLAAAWPLGRAFRAGAQARESLEQRARAEAAEHEQQAREAVAAERARIARDLHDVVGHGLSIVVLQLVGAAALLETGAVAGASGKLAAAESSARLALDEMRRLLALLGPDAVDEGLAPQPGLRDLSCLVEEARQAGASVSLVVDGDLGPVPAGVDLAAYRIVQESLTNVLRHSRPPDCTVRVALSGATLEVEVLDEGAAPAMPTGRAGRGLAGVRERAALYQGSAEIGPREGRGFGVSVRLPVADP
jgi:signal transduction histidine kinase